MDNQEPKQLVPVVICEMPKTVLMLEKGISESEKQRRIARYFDKKGNFKIDTMKEQSVYNNSQNNNF